MGAYLSLGIHLVITPACIHYLKYLPNRWLMLGKWSDSIFWNLSLLGDNVPRFLLAVWFFFPISELACSVQKIKEKQSRSVALGCSVLPFSFHQDLRSCALGCWVLSVSDKPRSQLSAWQWHGRSTSSQCGRAGPSPLQEGHNPAQPARNFIHIFKSFWCTYSVLFSATGLVNQVGAFLCLRVLTEQDVPSSFKVSE